MEQEINVNMEHATDQEENLVNTTIKSDSQTLKYDGKTNDSKTKAALNYHGKVSIAKGYSAIRCQFY